VTLRSPTGVLKPKNMVAMFLFTHYWYWFPSLLFLPLALEPTFLAGVTADLKVPAGFSVTCKAAKKYFDYHRPAENVEEKKKEVGPAVLSITRRAKVRQDKKDAEKEARSSAKPTESMIIEEVPEQSEKADKPDAKTDAKDDKKSYQLTNPSRVLKKQLNFIEFSSSENERYIPVVENIKSGIIFLKDTKPGAPETFAFEQAPAPVPGEGAHIIEDAPKTP